jgi:hypothetical protein
MIKISCDRQGWAECEVAGERFSSASPEALRAEGLQRVRQATVELLLAELVRRRAVGPVRILARHDIGYVQFPDCGSALRGLTAAGDREEADRAVARAMATNQHIGIREGKKNPPWVARNQF